MARHSITLSANGGEFSAGGNTFSLNYSTNESRFLYAGSSGDVYVTDENGATDMAAAAALVPTRNGYDFTGFYPQGSDTKYVGSGGKILKAFRDAAADPGVNGTWLYARWQQRADHAWGQLTDWFDAETSSYGRLMLARSKSGATRTNVATTCSGALAIQAADSAVAGYRQGPELLNPVCTYRIKEPGYVSFTLGQAYGLGGKSYMLVAVEYRTKADGEPTLTLRGVANEGEDAINTWQVTFDVDPDHAAQDPATPLVYGLSAGAVSGGGELVECTTVASCDPVVVRIDGVPVASDVVRGKLTVNAVTAAYLGEGAPTAKNGFVLAGVPKEESDVDFSTFSLTAERSL